MSLRKSSLILLIFAPFFCITKPDFFSSKLLLPASQEESIPFNFPQIDTIVKEPLRYLSRGAETIVFVSADDQYVVKFFLQKKLITTHYLQPKKRMKQLLAPLFSLKRDQEIIRRYEQGLKRIPELTAMLAVHRVKSPEQLPPCKLIDYHGICHTLDLNELSFAIQKKASILKRKDLTDNREKLHDLFASLSSSGFINVAPEFNTNNFALLNDKAILIDLGELKYCPEKACTLEEASLHKRYINALDSSQ